MIQGVLFDMDGVLIDSEEYIKAAAVKMFAEHNYKAVPDDFLPFVGAGEDRFIGGVAEKYGYKIDLAKSKARTYEIYLELIKGNLGPLPGVKEFIQKCKDLKIKMAIATSADKVKMIGNIEAIGIPLDTFDATVNGLEIERKKPFPDIYLKAANLINVPIENCLVVEDAVNGVEAAKRAGAKCLALTTSFSKEQLKGADWFAENLAFAPDDVLNW